MSSQLHDTVTAVLHSLETGASLPGYPSFAPAPDPDHVKEVLRMALAEDEDDANTMDQQATEMAGLENDLAEVEPTGRAVAEFADALDQIDGNMPDDLNNVQIAQIVRELLEAAALALHRDGLDHVVRKADALRRRKLINMADRIESWLENRESERMLQADKIFNLAMGVEE